MKTRTRISLIAAATLACLSQPSVAADVAVSGELGTTGIGLHVSVPLPVDRLSARFGLNNYDYSLTMNTSDVNYKATLKLNTVDALLNWHPWASNGFRVTAGIVWNGNKVDAKAKPKGGQYEINDNVYDATAAGSLKGKIDFNDVAPYLGIGWGNAPAKKGWSFSGDLGVLFQGSPSVSLKSRDCSAGATLCQRLANDVEVERKKLKDDAKDFRYYPVIRLGVSYRF
ncbi:MAG: hypothetical protein LBP58_10410 [Azoarcus sp.]|jgi:hypothetical protein|nr:hypothetical protein [Azoarcus sp.]